MIECGVAASGDVLCLWRCCCLSAVLAARQAMLPYSKLPLLHRSRVHLRLSSSVLAVHLHLHGLVLRHRRTAMFCASRRDSSSRRSARRTSRFTACASPSLGFTPLAASAPSCLAASQQLGQKEEVQIWHVHIGQKFDPSFWAVLVEWGSVRVG